MACKAPALHWKPDRSAAHHTGSAAQQLLLQVSPEQTSGNLALKNKIHHHDFGMARAAHNAYLGLCSAGKCYLRVNLKEMR